MNTTFARNRRRHPIERPEPGTWRIDPGRAKVTFVATHFLPDNLFGPFTQEVPIRIPEVSGSIVIADDQVSSTVELALDMSSLSTGDRRRDTILRSPEVFDVAEFPTATFEGAVTRGPRSHGRIVGAFTFRGTTRHAMLETGHHAFVRDPSAEGRGVFLAVGEIDRAQWGLTSRVANPPRHLLLSNAVRLELELAAIHEP